MTPRTVVVVVAGGAGRIGRAVAAAAARSGRRAVLADSDLAAARRAARALRLGDRVVAERVDITSKASLDSLIARVSRAHGPIGAFVNCAYPRGPRYGARFEDVRYEDFCRTVSLHLGGYFLAAQRFGLHFKRRRRGQVVSLASIYGVVAPRFEIYPDKMTTPVEYAAIKAGIIHLTRYMASYFKGTGVRFNSVSPGGILDAQPAFFRRRYKAYCSTKGLLSAEDAAGAVQYLLSDAASAVNGHNLVVDDGFTL